MNVLTLRGFADSQLDGPRRHLALCAELRADVLKRPRTAADLSSLLGNELDRARLANALGEPDVLQQALASAAALAAAMTVRERVSGGEVELTLTGVAALRFPDGDTGASVPLWLDGLACAVVMRDAEACEYLANPIALESVSRAAANRNAQIGNEPFWPEYARAFVALVHGRPVAVSHAQRAGQQITTGPTGVLVREGLAATDLPVLQLIEVVASGAKAEWPAAVRSALEKFHACFGNTSHLPGYLPLLVLAVCRIAVERGFEAPQSSPYLPEELLSGAHAFGQTNLAVRYPLQVIVGADEAHWFLDLQGYPRKGRRHRLLEREGRLIAIHEVDADSGLPPASVEFAVVDDYRDEPSVPVALDAGQLLFLAQAFASQVPADSGSAAPSARVLLNDAIACVDAALARIPAGSDAVPSETLQSEEGRALLASEPGRFRRARLTAYRDSLKALLHRPAARPESPEPTRDDPMQILQSAQISIDVIRGQAMPVLQAFAQDEDGTFVRSLQPRDDDYDKVFVGEAVSEARSAYSQWWSSGFDWPRPRSAQTDIRCAVSPAGMFQWRNELSQRFPGGYQGIASSLNPHRVWIAWKYLEPGQPSGLSFDGLVWLDDHWAWFPKPYRHLAAGGAGRQERQ